MTKVDVSRSYYGYKIRLNGVLHLWLPVEGDVSIESWVDASTGRCSIEYITEQRTVRTEYECKETWLEILSQLETFLPK